MPRRHYRSVEKLRGGGRGHVEAQGTDGSRGGAKSMLGQLPSDLRQTLLVGVT